MLAPALFRKTQVFVFLSDSFESPNRVVGRPMRRLRARAKTQEQGLAIVSHVSDSCLGAGLQWAFAELVISEFILRRPLHSTRHSENEVQRTKRAGNGRDTHLAVENKESEAMTGTHC